MNINSRGKSIVKLIKNCKACDECFLVFISGNLSRVILIPELHVGTGNFQQLKQNWIIIIDRDRKIKLNSG